MINERLFEILQVTSENGCQLFLKSGHLPMKLDEIQFQFLLLFINQKNK